MALQSAGRKAIEQFMTNGKPFNHGNLKGRTVVQGVGRLPKRWHFQLLGFDGNRDGSEVGVQILYSYDTPIAWKFANRGDWVIPNVRYSDSTTNHQRTAMAYAERYVSWPQERIDAR